MPYVTTSYATLYKFLKTQQEFYMFYDRVWVQNINRINKCTTFVHQNTEAHECEHPHPFICEMGKYQISYICAKKQKTTVTVPLGLKNMVMSHRSTNQLLKSCSHNVTSCSIISAAICGNLRHSCKASSRLNKHL